MSIVFSATIGLSGEWNNLLASLEYNSSQMLEEIRVELKKSLEQVLNSFGQENRDFAILEILMGPKFPGTPSGNTPQWMMGMRIDFYALLPDWIEGNKLEFISKLQSNLPIGSNIGFEKFNIYNSSNNGVPYKPVLQEFVPQKRSKKNVDENLADSN